MGRSARMKWQAVAQVALRMSIVVVLIGSIMTPAFAAAPSKTYDLCVQAQGGNLLETVRLMLIVHGADPGDRADLLGAAMAWRLVWGERAETVNAEPYDPRLCSAVHGKHTVQVELTEAEVKTLRAVRSLKQIDWRHEKHRQLRPDTFTRIANRAVQSKALASPSAPEGSEPFQLVRVYFATNRNRPNETQSDKRFGNGRGESITYGTVAVAIPKDHRMGNLETPSIFRLEFRKDPGRHVSLESTELLSKDRWRSELMVRANRMGKPGVLLFVHGYNLSFSDAAERTGQLAYDLAFPGPSVFFAWPSQGGLAKYVVDEQMAEYSVIDMQQLLADLAELVPGGPVYVVAHSMGSRVLARALVELLATDLGKRRAFKEIVLTAPDIDADVFKRDIAPKILGPGPHFTLYANSKDRALPVLDAPHGVWRLGEGGDRITVLNGIDSIDASRVKTDFIAHSYFGDADALLSDLFYVIRESKPADKRVRLEAVTRSDGKYWRFKP